MIAIQIKGLDVFCRMIALNKKLRCLDWSLYSKISIEIDIVERPLTKMMIDAQLWLLLSTFSGPSQAPLRWGQNS